MRTIIISGLATLFLVACSSSDTTTVEVVVPTPAIEQNITEPVFEDVRELYEVDEGNITINVFMKDDPNLDIFNFLVVVTDSNGYGFYEEPNTYRRSGRIFIEDSVELLKEDRYSIDVVYMGETEYLVSREYIKVEFDEETAASDDNDTTE